MAQEELFVSIYLDADVEKMIAKALRRQGYTCHAADEVGMKQASPVYAQFVLPQEQTL